LRRCLQIGQEPPKTTSNYFLAPGHKRRVVHGLKIENPHRQEVVLVALAMHLYPVLFSLVLFLALQLLFYNYFTQIVSVALRQFLTCGLLFIKNI
jgi:hypothetical protein